MCKVKALHFGAGNIGRGFIAPILVESGYHVVFADINSEIVHRLNETDSYTVHIISSNGNNLDHNNDDEPHHHHQDQPVSSISGVVSNNDEIISILADPAVQLVTTAVGPDVLQKVAPTLAKGLQARRKAGAGALNVIACENRVGATAELSHYVFEHLPSEEDKTWTNEHVGFACCSVDCIVPPSDNKNNTVDKDENSLDVQVEDFHEWIVDEGALKRPIEPQVKGIEFTRDLQAYVERKLFTLNGSHAIAAYLGHVKGYRTIDEAMADQEISNIVRGALKECGDALINKYHFERAAHEAYVEKVLTRISDPSLQDSIVRVGRDPLRKLKKGDRLLAPVDLAKEYGLPNDCLLRGVAAAFMYEEKEDVQSVELAEKVRRVGIGEVVKEVTGYEEGSEEYAKVLRAYSELRAVNDKEGSYVPR